MEYYHCAVAFSVIKSDPWYNLFKNLDAQTFNAIWSNIIYWVLGTDNALHGAHVKELEAELGKEFDHTKQKKMIVRALLHAADLSNGTRPTKVSEFWSFAVLDEFFA